MQVNVRFLDNLKLEANFENFSIYTDQPVRYKGDGTAPAPYDYFLASSALCAAYFVKVYCKARNIPTEDIKLLQNNIVDPENRYHQDLSIELEIPDNISEKDQQGMLAAMERCTVKRVIQNTPKFEITVKKGIQTSNESKFDLDSNKETQIIGKDLPVEKTISFLFEIFNKIGINLEIASWRNPIPHVWSVHLRDGDSPICYTNGKGATKESALASALGEYLERIANNYFYNDYYLGQEISNNTFVHYPNELWFKKEQDLEFPSELMDDYLFETYNPSGELKFENLIDTNSANSERGICALPFVRQSDNKEVYIPVNLIGNLFVSNGMSAGNTLFEARVQCLSEIFERAVKNKIITEEITLPDIPKSVINRFPNIVKGIEKLESEGFEIYLKDASLGGKYPVLCVTLMNPKGHSVFASFGAHPRFEVALERSLTELLQGRSFEGFNELPAPTFNELSITEHNNIIDHFIDSSGVISWKFFSKKFDYKFVDWDFQGSTESEYKSLMNILAAEKKEVYISDYTDLGGHACRILVPNFSEIYQVEDLIWDNNNQAIEFREKILNIHSLSKEELIKLIEKFDFYEIDDYLEITELIGVAFDESSAWGQLTVCELKAFIYLVLEEFDMAKENVELFLNFNETGSQRRSFFNALNTHLELKINDELNFGDYKDALKKMYGDNSQIAQDVINSKVKYYGLFETDMNFKNNRKHLDLIDSYKKLIKVRSNIV